MMGACHIVLGTACLGAYPGVGAFHSTKRNSYLGAYPGVGAYLGYYGICEAFQTCVLMLFESCS